MTDQPQPANPPAPPSCPDSRSCPEPTNYGCLGCAAVFLLAIIGAWWLWPDNSRPMDTRSFLPAGSVLLVQVPNPEELARNAGNLPLWQIDQGRRVISGLQDHIAAALRKELSDARPDNLKKLFAKSRNFTLAFAPNEQNQLAWIVLLQVHDIKQTLRILNDDLWLNQTRTSVEGIEISSIKCRNNTSIWYHNLGSLLIITPDLGLMKFALTAGSGKQKTLNGRPACPRPAPGSLMEVMLDVREIRKRQLQGQSTANSLATMIFAPIIQQTMLSREQCRSIDPEARLLIQLQRDKDRDCIITTRIVAPTRESHAHGFWYYAAWVILTPIALIVIIVLTVVLITLLMAAYFYAVSWWKGELSPPAPPTTPPFSQELQEDLAAGPKQRPETDSRPRENAENAPGGDGREDTGQTGEAE